MKLNPPQQQAVACRKGPLLVLAGPGSGKTATVTHRTAALLTDGVDPQSVLLVTFTRKAAAEMRERVAKLVGRKAASGMWIGTFHATCARLLREMEEDSHREDRKADFVIYDQDDSKALVKNAIKSLNLDVKIWSPRETQERISRAKNAGLQPEDIVADDPRTETSKRIWTHYEQQLLRSNGFDYDDLQLVIMRLLESGRTVGQALQHRFTHITVDEYQDTNHVQFRIIDKIAASRNLCVVGDHRQCIPAGQMVRTPGGFKPIEEVRVGDTVASVKGGKEAFRPVVAVSKTTKEVAYEYNLGEHGQFQATKEHVLFAAIDDPRGALVYLMYRPDMGYRLGVSRTVGHRGDNFVVRTQQEQAERLWVLAWFDSYAEGAELEAHLAYEWQVPREPFKSRSGMWADGSGTERLFKVFGQNGRRLLDWYGLDFERPNYVAKTSRRHGRVAVNLVVGTKDFHRVEVETSHVDQEAARSLGMKPTGKGTFRLRVCTRQLADAEDLAMDLAMGLRGYVVQSLSGTNAKRRMLAVPAASVHPGMRVPVLVDGRLQAVPVLGRRTVDAGDCYDLQVDELGTFTVNDVVVHNSIYAFRGADVRNILSFSENYPDARVVDLNINYRSTPQVVSVFNALFEDCAMSTPNAPGPRVRVTQSATEEVEASDIVSRVMALVERGVAPNQIAVLYRMHALSRAIEERLRNRGIRYQVVGGRTFYERSEVKDVIAYLRLVENPHSNVDLQRVINTPRRAVSAKTVDKLREVAHLKRCSLWDAIPTLLATEKLNANTQQGLRRFMLAIKHTRQELDGTAPTLPEAPPVARPAPQQADLFGTAPQVATAPAEPEREASPADNEKFSLASLTSGLLDRTGYRQHWVAEVQKLSEKRKPVELERALQKQRNVEEVVAAVDGYEMRTSKPTLGGYLQEVALMADQDQLKGESVSLMTVHASKGLEFDAVFLVGCEEGLLPFSKAIAQDEIDEERRLMFVACSRARKYLTLTTASCRYLHGKPMMTEPSRFLEELPPHVLDMDRALARKINGHRRVALAPIELQSRADEQEG